MRFARGVFLACIIAGFVALLFASGSPPGMLESQGEVEEVADAGEDVRMEGMEFAEWTGQDLAWLLHAQQGRYYHQESRATLEQVDASFFPASGGRLRLWANRLEYDLDGRKMVAREAVRGASDEGYRFYTETLSYDTQTRQVWTDDKVTLVKDRLTIQGTGMRGSLARRRFELVSSVRAVFSPKELVP